MSNEMFDTEEELAGEEQQPTAGKKKIGFLPAIVIDILKWAAIVVGAVIFIVGVVIVTIRIMDRGEEPTGRYVPLDSDYVSEGREELSWFSQIGDIRGQTDDTPPQTFIVNAHIGFRREDEQTSQELIVREVQIKETIAIYFAERSASEVNSVEGRMQAKEELRARINAMMNAGREESVIREVAFDRYEFIEF